MHTAIAIAVIIGLAVWIWRLKQELAALHRAIVAAPRAGGKSPGRRAGRRGGEHAAASDTPAEKHSSVRRENGVPT